MAKKPHSNHIPLRPDKTIDWLNKSRNDWKDKTLETKAALKVAKQARKRAEASRQQWRERCKQLEAESEMEQRQQNAEIARLQEAVAQLEQQNEVLKKSTYWAKRSTPRAAQLYTGTYHVGITCPKQDLTRQSRPI